MNSSLPNFHTDVEWFQLQNRGDVASVRIDRDCDRDKLLDTFRRVIIEGKEYDVKDIESNAITPIRKGSRIGLLVEKR